MKLENYHSGSYASQGDFSSIVPSLVDVPWEWSDTSLNMLLEKASHEIGGLNAFAELVPNMDIYKKCTYAQKRTNLAG